MRGCLVLIMLASLITPASSESAQDRKDLEAIKQIEKDWQDGLELS